MVVGDVNRTKGDEYPMEKIILHEHFNQSSLQNDLCLIKVKTAIKFNDRIKPISIRPSQVNVGEVAIVTGWGYQGQHNPDVPIILQYAAYTTMDNQQCKDRFINQNDKDSVTEKNICMMPKENQSNCPGDSGGPLAIDGELVGVVSWGVGNPNLYCGRLGTPNVFVKVAEYQEWIRKTMERNLNDYILKITST